MPFVYARFFGVLGLFRKLLVNIISIFRPMMLEVSENDMRVTAHKSCALAAQTFMIAMANEGYDTCPLEGLDSRRLKRIWLSPVEYGTEIKESGENGAEYRLTKFIVESKIVLLIVKPCHVSLLPFL